MDTQNGEQKQKTLSWGADASKTTPASPLKTAETKAVVIAPLQKTSGAGRYVAYAAAVIVAGMLLVWGYQSWRPTPAPEDGKEQQTTNSTANGSQTNGTAIVSSGLVSVSAQKAGMSVVVGGVVVGKPTWVVVYESRDGKLGNILGAALFDAGKQAGTIGLLRATEAGNAYFVGEFTDNGDRQFSLKNDAAVRDAEGELLVTQFAAQ